MAQKSGGVKSEDTKPGRDRQDSWDVREVLQRTVDSTEEYDQRLRSLFRPSPVDTSRRLR